ncbi:hypothetical protein [Inquilinus sp. CA228]|uniref:hypothetical protein n=1 Tax=Inquilinus sp. CA228 TaxID=3455609 RepID=UPI003F8D410A
MPSDPEQTPLVCDRNACSGRLIGSAGCPTYRICRAETGPPAAISSVHMTRRFPRAGTLRLTGAGDAVTEPPVATSGRWYRTMADVYGAITDAALNWIVGFAHVRAPFLFNYVAPTVQAVLGPDQKMVGVQDLWLTCAPVPDSPLPGVPKYRRMPPFQLPGIPIGLPYSVQIVDAKIDFHPGDQVTLPEELLPPLRDQTLALRTQLLFGLACVPDGIVEVLTRQHFGFTDLRPQFSVLPVTELQCFVLDLYATGRLAVQSTAQPGPYPLQQIRLQVDGIEIVDITPKGLEGAVECYLRAILKGYVLPKLVLGLEELILRTLGITFTPHLTLGLPNNPAAEQNELRVWLDLEMS